MVIFIRSNFEGIMFHHESFSIREEIYRADKDGNKLADGDERISNGKYYDFGDIILESPSLKVIFSKVYEPYSWSSTILDHIEKHLHEDVIVLDLNTINADCEFSCGNMEIITK